MRLGNHAGWTSVHAPTKPYCAEQEFRIESWQHLPARLWDQEWRCDHSHVFQPGHCLSDAGTYPIIPALVDPTLKLGNYAVTSIMAFSRSILAVDFHRGECEPRYGNPNRLSPERLLD